MPFIEDIAYGFLAPAVVAAGASLLLRRTGARDGSPASVAFLAGFLSAYALFDFEHNWKWLPHIALAALLAGTVIHAPAAHRAVRWGVFLVLAILVALLIVPDWKSLEGVRHWHQFVIAVSLFSLCVVLEPLPKRFPGAMLPVLLFVAALAGVGVLALSGNMKLAQLSGAVAAAMLGCALVSCIGLRESQEVTAPFTVLLGSLIYSGYVGSFSQVPLASYALVCAAPAGLWVCTAGPLARLRRPWNAVARTAAVLVPLAVGLFLAVMAEPPWTG